MSCNYCQPGMLCPYHGNHDAARAREADEIVRELAKRRDCFCPTDPCDSDCVVQRARAYVEAK